MQSNLVIDLVVASDVSRTPPRDGHARLSQTQVAVGTDNDRSQYVCFPGDRIVVHYCHYHYHRLFHYFRRNGCDNSRFG
jgi:hypothetical protein